MDSGVTVKQTESEDEVIRSSTLEPSTLPWPGDRQTGGQTGKGDRVSVRSSEAASWTESERELLAESKGGVKGGADDAEGVELIDKWVGLKTHLEEDPAENHLPEKAAQVFSPAVTVLPSPSSPRETEVFWEMESEKSPFLGPRVIPQDYNQHGYQFEWTENTPPARCGQCCSSRDILKMGVSLVTSALFFPFLVWGGFVFLPFDAPLLDNAPLRLVYTLRCSVFAAMPIVLGWLVLGITRLRSGVSQPLFDEEVKEAELREVTIHHRFVSDSTSLFLIYFLQLVVMAMYMTFGSSIRGFGFGLSFLPCLVMMVANIYFIFTVEAAGSIFILPPASMDAQTPPAGRQ
ncbi:hypothetical protein INR49_019671, partial [Caranx melampygus]